MAIENIKILGAVLELPPKLPIFAVIKQEGFNFTWTY